MNHRKKHTPRASSSKWRLIIHEWRRGATATVKKFYNVMNPKHRLQKED